MSNLPKKALRGGVNVEVNEILQHVMVTTNNEDTIYLDPETAIDLIEYLASWLKEMSE